MTASDLRAEADVRGTLDVRHGVVVRIAEIAAANVEGVERVAGGLTTRALPNAEARIRAGRAVVSVDAATRWPTPIADVAARVRAAVERELNDTSGVEVDSVVVDVRYLAPEFGKADKNTHRRVR